MFRAFIVDDEPIILSGISHLIDWEKKLDCEIVGCFRNGKDAYEAIASSSVDIVLTDIKMPLMDGMELIKKCHDEYPQIVFAILSSLEEFRLVREAIKYGVTEYLVKTELDESSLEAVIERCKEEAFKRRELYHIRRSEEVNDRDIKSLVANLFLMREFDVDIKQRLETAALLSNYAFIGFSFQYPLSTFESNWSIKDCNQLYQWQKDIVEKILFSLFPSAMAVTPAVAPYCYLFYYIHDEDPKLWNARLNRLSEIIKKASSIVTRLDISIISSSIGNGSDGLLFAREELENECDYLYLGKRTANFGSPSLDGVYSRVEFAIKNKNVVAFDTALKLIIATLSSTDHRLSNAVFVSSALQHAIRAGLSSLGLPEDKLLNELFAYIPYTSTRDKMVQSFEDIRQETEALLYGIGSASSSQTIDKAREYVVMHISEHISLADVASYAGVSSSYMSKNFKRIMGKSLVDYINAMKVEKAKERMKVLGYFRINELALELGFDNIYYFSKVFKKATGITPSEYAKTLRDDMC